MSTVSRHPFRLATTLFIALAGCLTEAGAVKREVIKTYQDEFAEHSYRLRVDLQGINYLSVPNVVTDRGFNYQGRQFPVMFRELQMVYLARFSNAGGNEVALTIYRTKEDAEQVRGAVPSTPFGPAAGTEIALGAFARDLSTTVTLVLRSEKKDLAAQKDEILRLLNKLFYIKTEPTAEEKEAFIRSHADLPLPKLSSLTGLPEEMIRAILETAKTAPQLDDTEKEEKKE